MLTATDAIRDPKEKKNVSSHLGIIDHTEIAELFIEIDI